MKYSPVSAKASQVVLVMPCLNEANNLKQTCLSLGFGSGSQHHSPNSALIIVDNGSSDTTAEVAADVRRASEPNTVHVIQEAEQGYVPARHAGNLFARALAESSKWDEENVLVLQVDADCNYLPDYVNAMKEVAEHEGRNVMIEACIGYPPDFQKDYSEYVRICDETDVEFEKLFPRSLSHDDVAVDAVCGYRLADYFRWGGHRREFNAGGEEIHAETTRMFMRARTQGARRRRVDRGLALHSARKAYANPALHISTGGFPREDSWNRTWQRNYKGPSNIDDFCAHTNHPEVVKAVRVREEHLLALFGVLPLHVDRALGQPSDKEAESERLSAQILPLLSRRTRDDLASHPGILLSDVFNLISEHGTQLLDEARQVISKNSR